MPSYQNRKTPWSSILSSQDRCRYSNSIDLFIVDIDYVKPAKFCSYCHVCWKGVWARRHISYESRWMNGNRRFDLKAGAIDLGLVQLNQGFWWLSCGVTDAAACGCLKKNIIEWDRSDCLLLIVSGWSIPGGRSCSISAWRVGRWCCSCSHGIMILAQTPSKPPNMCCNLQSLPGNWNAEMRTSVVVFYRLTHSFCPDVVSDSQPQVSTEPLMVG